jgi:hypothetical protein
MGVYRFVLERAGPVDLDLTAIRSSLSLFCRGWRRSYQLGAALMSPSSSSNPLRQQGQAISGAGSRATGTSVRDLTDW